MSALTIRAAVGQVTGMHRRTGLPLPAKLADALATIDEATPDALGIEPDRAGLVDAMHAALTAGRDPLTDKAVTRHLAALTLAQHGTARLVTEWADTRRAAVMLEHMDALVHVWADDVNATDAAVEELREAAPSVNLTDPAGASQLGTTEQTPYAVAVDGLRRADLIAATYRAVMPAVGACYVNPADWPLILADLPAAVVDRYGPRVTAAQLAQDGHALSLPTPAEFTARTRRAAAERTQGRARTDAERERRTADNLAPRMLSEAEREHAAKVSAARRERLAAAAQG